MIQETRSQKSGPTAGERADLQLVRKSSVNSRQELVATENRRLGQRRRQKSTPTWSQLCHLRSSTKCQSSRQLRSSDGCEWLRRSRRPRRFQRCSAVSEIVDTPVPQVEEDQTVDVATHSSKLEADVQRGCRVEHGPRCLVSCVAED